MTDEEFIAAFPDMVKEALYRWDKESALVFPPRHIPKFVIECKKTADGELTYKFDGSLYILLTDSQKQYLADLWDTRPD